MLTLGQTMQLLIPNGSDKGVLRAGKVVETSRETFTIELESPAAMAVGFETLAYCDLRGKFFQQGATLMEVRGESVKPAYLFARSSEPVSAEQRQTFRVSVALANISAQVGLQKKCQVADFSAEGMAVIGSPGFSIGSVQKVVLSFDGFSINADARVQTIKVLASGRVRYGFLVPHTNIAARVSLQKITAYFQRTQLRRLAGAA